MNTLSTPAKRSSYPFSVVLILLAHLVLGYMIYQQVAQPDRAIVTVGVMDLASAAAADGVIERALDPDHPLARARLQYPHIGQTQRNLQQIVHGQSSAHRGYPRFRLARPDHYRLWSPRRQRKSHSFPSKVSHMQRFFTCGFARCANIPFVWNPEQKHPVYNVHINVTRVK